MNISIALATYNGARFIREQLDSFAKQSRLPDELVVSDDGSTDATVRIVEEFAATAPFVVRLHRNRQKLGFAKNFERAIKFCSGDLVFLSDQDDAWDSNKIALVEQAFVENPDTMSILNDARLVDESAKWFGDTQLRRIRKAGIRDHAFITGCCSAHRKRFLDLILPMDDCVEHDLWINRTAHAAGVSLVVDRTLQCFRRHGNTSTNWPLSTPTKRAAWQISAHLTRADIAPEASWQYSRDMLTSVIRKIEKRPDLGCEEQRWLSALRNERDAFASRLHALRVPRRRRWSMVFRMMICGQYQSFSGWRSAVKDLIRPVTAGPGQ